MKIGVTGGSGFIGSHVVDSLVEQGHEVTVLDIVAPNRQDVEFRKMDLLDEGSCEQATDGLEVIYHMAAVADVNVAIKNKHLTFNLNVRGTAYLLEACEKNGVSRIIYASTEWVYNCLEEAGQVVHVREEDALDANKMQHIYTLSKYMGEMLCRSYCSYSNLNFTILRFGIPYGPRARTGTVFYNFLNNALAGKPLQINGKGLQFRKFIFVTDLAKGCTAALKDVAVDQTYNLSGQEPITIRAVAESVKELFDGNVEIEYQEARDQDFGGVVAEIDKASLELDWNPNVALTEGVRQYLNWLQEQQGTSVPA